MRALILIGTMVLSFAAFAQNNKCDRYAGNVRFTKAIETVAQNLDLSFVELCNLPKIMDIEAQPSRLISREGEIIPHVRVQLHMSYESCLYMVKDSDQTISKQYCYSGF